MTDNTIGQPSNQQSKPTFDTVVYRVCAPKVRLFEIDVFDTIGAILNFRPSGMRVAREIIKRQGGENITITITDAELAEALFPDLPEATRVNKVVRGKKNLTDDQTDSRFRFIWKAPRQVEQKEDGSYYGLPCKYRPGDYWSVSDELQFRSERDSVDFFALTIHKRRKLEREMLSVILGERGFNTIVRLRKKKDEEEKEEKAPSLPCPKGCAHCALNEAAKSATGSEANGAKPAESRVTKQSVEAELHALNDAIFECGQRWMNLGLGLDAFNGKVHRDYVETIKRLQDAMKRANAPKVKLVGGQPK